MARLPNDHSDNETWGTILNEYLSVSHNPDGTLKASSTSASLKTFYKDSDVDTLYGNSNNTWMTGPTPCIATFTAPASGAVLITLTGMLRSGDNWSGQLSYTVVRVSTGAAVVALTNSGSTGSAALPGRYLLATPLTGGVQRWIYGSISRQLTGLVAGENYTASVYGRNLGTSANGSADANKPLASWRSLIIQQLAV